MSTPKLKRFCFRLGVGGAVGMCGWLLVISRHLRPGGDDYWAGAVVGRHGIIGGLTWWWDHWSAFIYSVFWDNLLVGAPLIYLPIRMASAVAFWATLIAMGWVLVGLIGPRETRGRHRLALAVLGGLGWFVYMRAPVTFNSGHRDLILLGRGLSDWQILNGTYVIQFQTLLLAWVLVWRRVRPLAVALAAAAVLGVVAGASGSAISVAITTWAGLCALACAVRWAWGRWRTPAGGAGRAAAMWAVLSLATCAATGLLHKLSPGHAIRAAGMKPRSVEFTPSFVAEATGYVMPYVWEVCSSAYISYGAAFVLVSAVTFAFLGSPSSAAEPGSASPVRPMLKVAAQLAGFAVLHAMVARFAEFLTYEGYWHVLTSLIGIYLSLACAGWAAGRWLAGRSAWADEVGFVMQHAVVAALAVCFVVNAEMNDTMRERKRLWHRGAAPTPATSDIEPPAHQDGWWQVIQECRREPVERGNDDAGGTPAPPFPTGYSPH